MKTLLLRPPGNLGLARVIVMTLAILAGTALVLPSSGAADEEGFTRLFDGRTLDGWKPRGGKAKYAVEDGVIVGTTVLGEPNSFLCTEKQYSDFILDLEFRVDTGLNSGIQIRSHAYPNNDRITVKVASGKIEQKSVEAGRVHGYQVEIDPSDRAWTGGIYDEARRGWLNDLKGNEPARKAFKRDAWNHLRVVAQGDSIKTWLNGVPAADLQDDMTLSGFIGLQVHGTKETRPLQVRWRNIRLKEITVGPYQSTGCKVGEVTDTSAIVWSRLTRRPQRNPSDAAMVEIIKASGKPGEKAEATEGEVVHVQYPNGLTVEDIRDAAPGLAGQVRVRYKPANEQDWLETAWEEVAADRDFTRQFLLEKLQPDMRYFFRVQTRAGRDMPLGQSLDGRFRTAPARTDPARVVFTVSTGQAYKDKDLPDGYKIYAQMLKLDPSFFVHTGDIVYYDELAKTIELARYHWQRTYGLPTNVEFHRQVASSFIKDDHDTWQNDCWPAMQNKKMFQFTFAQGQSVFREQVPMGASTYRTGRWGKDLQVWLVEGRDFRSPNDAPDGSKKTIWGTEQKAWFKRTVQESDATFRILISPTPLVGPDRPGKHDNHSNKDFTNEGDELRRFISSQKNMAVVCGDRHWQYVSVHPQTGVREFSCGPASNEHAGGWKQEDFVPAYHRYLNVIGGFLAATVERVNGVPTLTFRHYDVEGKVRFEDVIKSVQ